MQQPSREDLVGTWIGSGPTIPLIEIEFLESNAFHMRLVTASGENLLYDGEYEIDFTKSPIPLTMRSISQLPHPIHTIIEFRDSSTIRMGAFSEKWRLRPLDFNPNTEMELTRSDEGISPQEN